MVRFFTIAGALLMFLGVGAGAFGAHSLSVYFGRFPEVEGTFETAVRYHQIHGLGLIVVAWATERWPGAWSTWAGYLFLLGVFLFSGSLYLLVFTRMRWLGAITPLGGLAFLAGWLCLLIAAWRS